MLAVACQKAVAPFRRYGLSKQLRRVITLEDLLSAGMLALLESGTLDEGLAVEVARGAMAKLIRRERRRLRDMVEVRDGYTDASGEEVTDADQWDITVYGKQNLRPVNTHPDLWEAMKALSARQYQAITLVYWGGKTLAEIGLEMGVSLQRVGQIVQEAKKNIQSALENGNPRGITTVRGKEAAPRTVLSGGTGEVAGQ